MAFQGDSIFWVEVEKIVPNPFQPRREFDETRLKELSESVRMYGILQPLTVTRREVQNEDGSFKSEYELIAGERRLRASKLAGLLQVPVIIREGEQSEQEKLELAIIENLQREDLNAVDRAVAFRQLADVFGMSHVQVAKKVGRSREYISNSIRLLALPEYMLNSLKLGEISEGHGRTLLMLNDRPEQQDTVFREILLKKLSVREVERIARSIATEKIRKKGEYDADLVEMEKKFTETLGTRVSIVKTEFGGRLTIDYFTQEDLEEMLMSMRREAKRNAEAQALMNQVETGLGPLNKAGELGNPRADELMILTASTGLELVSESAPLRPFIQIPVVTSELEPELNLVKSEENRIMEEDVEIPEVPKDEIIPEGLDIIAEVPSEPEPVIVPTVIMENISVPISDLQNFAPAPRSALRDQLASLLGRNKVVQASVVTQVVTEAIPPESVQSVQSEQPVVTTEVTEVPTPVVLDTADDSDLYSMKDFTI